MQGLLSKVAGAKNVSIDLAKGTADIGMNKHIATETLQSALKKYPKYQLSETQHPNSSSEKELGDEASWLTTYKPILLIFGYITILSIITAVSGNGFSILRAMRFFMAGFFLTFSFFKMLDLNGFTDSYAMYDSVAKKSQAMGLYLCFY